MIKSPLVDKTPIGNKISLLLLLSVVVILTSLSIGRFPITITSIFKIIIGDGDLLKTEKLVLLSLRLPRILTAILVGAALAGSGSVYQTVFKNPMVSPSVLGASSGAAFGAALSILMGLSGWTTQILSFLFGLGAVLLALLITALAGRKGKVLILVLSGMLVSTFFTSLISLIKYIADPQDILPEITYWLMGSLANSTLNNVIFIGLILIFSTSIIFLLRWKITLLSLNDDEARSLGITPWFYRLIVIICSTLLTSAAVSISGIIGWVGLIIPHIARIISPPKFQSIFITSLLIGGIYLLIIDTCSRVISPMEIPLGILTSLIGAPFFALFILRNRGEA